MTDKERKEKEDRDSEQRKREENSRKEADDLMLQTAVMVAIMASTM